MPEPAQPAARRAPIPTRPVAAPPAAAPPAAAPPRAEGVAIVVDNLRRVYGTQVALEGASFTVRRGEVFGFLGPNGAGKTTTMRILAGLLRPTAGSGRVDGLEVGPDRADAKAKVGFAPEDPYYPRQLKALPLLTRYAGFHGMNSAQGKARAAELLEVVGLTEASQKKIGNFSHGMRKRYGLAQAILHDPPVLLLDEPTAGMDPAAQAWFRTFVRGLAGQGKGVLLSTHLLHEASQVCDRVAVVNRGRVIAEDSPAGLTGRAAGRAVVRIEAEAPAGAERAVQQVPGVRAASREGPRFTVEVEKRELTADVVAALVGAGGRVMSVQAANPSLEDVFLQLTEAKP